MRENFCCGSWGQFPTVRKPLSSLPSLPPPLRPGYLVQVGETPQYTSQNLFPWRGNLRKRETTKAKILTPPQRKHSCSSSWSGRGASRIWDFWGFLRHQPLVAPLTSLCERAPLTPRSSFLCFPSSWRTAEPSCPNPPTTPPLPPPSSPLPGRSRPRGPGWGQVRGARAGLPEPTCQ